MILLAVLIVLVLVLGTILYTYLMRGTVIDEVRLIGPDEQHLDPRGETFRNALEAFTRTKFTNGNRIEPFFDNEVFYETLFNDIRSAQHLITWHVFYFRPGRLADKVADALTERVRSGVKVLFLYDQYGSNGVPADYFERLKEAGVETGTFRPYKWDNLYKAQQRMHVRAVVIDGRVGFTGGFGIADEWFGPRGKAWRETSVRMTGPVVDELQAAFASNWAESCGQLITGGHVFPRQQELGDRGVEAALFYSAPSLGTTAAERLLVSLISAAREKLYISTGYFVPDRGFRAYLRSAAERGVDVRVLTPGANTDEMLSFYAGVHVYEELIRSGIRIYHYRPGMMHAKTFMADGCFAVSGTLNFDNRSLKLNDEVVVMMHDAEITRRMEEAYLEDLEISDEIDLEWLDKRSRSFRLKGRLSHMVSRLL